MLVSVLINNYNYSSYLRECIDSVLSQTYPTIEIIVYDDGSKDNSIEVLKEYGELITVIANPNFGSFPSFNQGNAINQSFLISKGEIIFLLDSDDFFEKDKVAKVVKVFEEKQDVLLVQDDALRYVNGEVRGIHTSSRTNVDYLKLYYKKNWTAFYNPTSTLCFRRSYLNNILPLKIDKFWRVWPDVRMSRLVPFFGQVYSLKDSLTYYRRHTSNDSGTMNGKPLNALRNQICHHQYVNKYIKDNHIGTGEITYWFSYHFLKYIGKCFRPALLKVK
jgi:glycosyltransferase involved in cell wall biosynthesis